MKTLKSLTLSTTTTYIVYYVKSKCTILLAMNAISLYNFLLFLHFCNKYKKKTHLLLDNYFCLLIGFSILNIFIYISSGSVKVSQFVYRYVPLIGAYKKKEIHNL